MSGGGSHSCFVGGPGNEDQASSRDSCNHGSDSSASEACQLGWHLLLARLLSNLRLAIPEEERDLFDTAHARAHSRQLGLPIFFTYVLDRIRTFAKSLEPDFREVFRRRNMARKQARKSVMPRSFSASSLNSEDDDDLEQKLQRLSVTTDLTSPTLVDSNGSFNPTCSFELGKRNGDEMTGVVSMVSSQKSRTSKSLRHGHDAQRSLVHRC